MSQQLLQYIFLFLTILTCACALSGQVRLFDVCQRNAHCAASHSFCGWSEYNDESAVCLCRDGFKSSFDGSTCIPIHQWCSVEGFNDAMTPGGGCKSDKQFCRRNVCLCKANLMYDENGQCVSNGLAEEAGNMTRPMVYRSEQGLGFRKWKMENSIVEEEEEQSFAMILTYMVGLVVLMLFISIASTIFGIVYLKKFHNLKNERKYEKIQQQLIA